MEKLYPDFSYVELVGAVQGLFWCLLLGKASRPVRSARAGLVALLLATSLHPLWTALHDSRYLAYVPDLISLVRGAPCCFGPLLYLYVRQTLLPGFRWKPVHWLHFVPFILFQLGHIPFFLKPMRKKKAFILNHYVNHPPLDVFSQIPLIQFFLYMIPVIRLVNQHQRELKDYFSAIEQAKLDWLRNLIGTLALLYLIFIAGNLIVNLQMAGSVFALLLSGGMYYIGYRFIHYPVFFFPSGHSS